MREITLGLITAFGYPERSGETLETKRKRTGRRLDGAYHQFQQ
ncbi:hypothetical protein [Lacicoccus alkaliphilus]|uniref:Uncharacterized protein n=1 Tax=Lacicoccus alkaliphilus DSM 16010 TaxID=1123231 RepID=A0A1M7JT41_9BACL|nr:hypothetical protein [Salinicoccus alkaliphilus]SHM56158.1 hypothetical protein SAMN02745189_02371 [Salinicoccus alkaliphilus DSM 16010]